MFKLYGYLGIFLILLGEFLIFYRWEPFSTYLFFILLWLGYIFLVDALVYWKSGSSRLTNSPKQFWLLFLFSSLIWWFYEVLNIFIDNWHYLGAGKPIWLTYTLAFSTVLPAVLETSDFLSTFHFFQRKWKINLTKRKLSWILLLGIITLILPFIWPRYTYGLVWISMFFLLDPFNYLNKQESILGQLKSGKAKLLLTLMFGTLLCGFFWEFWNYWAPAKWFYEVPFVGCWKIFEMPILGYLGYPLFGLSLYALYIFIRSLLKK